MSLFLPLINPATPSARNISQIRSVIVTVCVNIPLYSMNGKLSFDVLRWDASIEWGHTYVLGPPPHTTPFPMTPPLLDIIYMFAFFPDVSNSCNICQVINAGCWKGEGIIWELMTCVTKQYCVLWHFAWLICVFNHSTLSPYPQALPFGPATPPTLIFAHAASLLQELIVCCVSCLPVKVTCVRVHKFHRRYNVFKHHPQEEKRTVWLCLSVRVPVRRISGSVRCLDACWMAYSKLRWCNDHLTSYLCNMEMGTRHQMSDSCTYFECLGETERRAGWLMPCQRSLCITQLFLY